MLEFEFLLWFCEFWILLIVDFCGDSIAISSIDSSYSSYLLSMLFDVDPDNFVVSDAIPKRLVQTSFIFKLFVGFVSLLHKFFSHKTPFQLLAKKLIVLYSITWNVSQKICFAMLLIQLLYGNQI